MGSVVEAEGNNEKGTAESDAEKLCASNPLVYQLVRVEGDGRLVPATEDELMEAEQLLEVDRTKLRSIEAKTHTEECPSSDWSSLKSTNLEGCSRSKWMEVDCLKLNERLEHIDVIPLKIKQEERMSLICETVTCSSKHAKSTDHANNVQSCDDRLQEGNTSVEMIGSPTCLNSSSCTRVENVETVTEPAIDANASGSSASETCTSSQPDFSILKGELCLDNLTIRELQEVFRATFGRQTSVKDKLWLKRRITMGLTNSCDVPTTGIIIKDNKVVEKKVKEEPYRVQQVMSGACFAPAQSNGSISDNSGDSQGIPANHTKDEHATFVKRVRKPLVEYDLRYENDLADQCSSKRTRKPTKRYIEELSEAEDKEFTGRLVSPVKNSDHHQVFRKSQVRPVHDIGPQWTTFVTRQDSIGGSGIQVPYVSRMRRSRPRKDFCALMNFGGMESDRRETFYHEEDQALEYEKINPAGGTSFDNNGAAAGAPRTLKVGVKRKHHRAWTPSEDFGGVKSDKRDRESFYCEEDQALEYEKIIPSRGTSTDDHGAAAGAARTLKVGVKRKHHRAWTLSEVLKLVEGVAQYGAGRWSEIRRLAFASYTYRTSVDLKDKWRNLLRASFAQEPSHRAVNNFRKHTSTPVPTPILMRVRELAELHSQAGIEFGPSKFAGQGGRVVQEKGSGFL